MAQVSSYREKSNLATSVSRRIDRGAGHATFDEFASAHPDLLDRQLTALLEHDSREALFSAEATRAFDEPDRGPLPGRPGG